MECKWVAEYTLRGHGTQSRMRASIGATYCVQVWAPTNYMVLRGLTQVGKDDLAADIGRNYHENIVKQFEDTGTLWENIAPVRASMDHETSRTGASLSYACQLPSSHETSLIVPRFNCDSRHCY